MWATGVNCRSLPDWTRNYLIKWKISFFTFQVRLLLVIGRFTEFDIYHYNWFYRWRIMRRQPLRLRTPFISWRLTSIYKAANLLAGRQLAKDSFPISAGDPDLFLDGRAIFTYTMVSPVQTQSMRLNRTRHLSHSPANDFWLGKTQRL